MTETILELKDGKNEDGTDRMIKVRIKFMGAYKAEQWMIRAALALGRGLGSNFSLSDIRKDHGKLIGAIANLDYKTAKPLLDELLACCSLLNGEQAIQLTESSCGLIQSPLTILRLRLESAKLNFSFFQDGDAWNSLFGGVI